MTEWQGESPEDFDPAMESRQRVRLIGGTLDGAEFLVGEEVDLPGEIIFRNASSLPYGDSVYRLDVGSLMNLDLSARLRTVRYVHCGKSEVMDLVDGQTRRLLVAEHDIRDRDKRIKRLQEQIHRMQGARKAAVTRRKKSRFSVDGDTPSS